MMASSQVYTVIGGGSLLKVASRSDRARKARVQGVFRLLHGRLPKEKERQYLSFGPWSFRTGQDGAIRE